MDRTVVYDPDDVTERRGPWWPNPLWGPDDRVGATNHITKDVVKDALDLPKTGKVYDLSQPTLA